MPWRILILKIGLIMWSTYCVHCVSDSPGYHMGQRGMDTVYTQTREMSIMMLNSIINIIHYNLTYSNKSIIVIIRNTV